MRTWPIHLLILGALARSSQFVLHQEAYEPCVSGDDDDYFPNAMCCNRGFPPYFSNCTAPPVAPKSHDDFADICEAEADKVALCCTAEVSCRCG
ncbi:hypothetical protein ANO11243_093690 [Dothideomycetidae sp. 11243]|nr:hypothetical protein ANO11243_093690 [fungal sp. No.11243]